MAAEDLKTSGRNPPHFNFRDRAASVTEDTPRLSAAEEAAPRPPAVRGPAEAVWAAVQLRRGPRVLPETAALRRPGYTEQPPPGGLTERRAFRGRGGRGRQQKAPEKALDSLSPIRLGDGKAAQ